MISLHTPLLPRLLSSAVAILLLSACASTRKSAVDTTARPTAETPRSPSGTLRPTESSQAETPSSSRPAEKPSSELLERNYVSRVADNAVTADNIVADMSIRIVAKGNDITLPGSIHLRRNRMIRLQVFIPILGSEVGRIDITPDEVLVVDRMHKEYCRAAIRDVDFLHRNGLDFFTLQDLFWNRLLMPANGRMSSSDLSAFSVVGLNGAAPSVRTSRGSLDFQWKTDPQSALITAVHADYRGGSTPTSIDWTYADFRPLGIRQYPTRHTIEARTRGANAQSATLTMTLEDLSTDSGWDVNTSLSSRYKEIPVKEALDRLSHLMK